MLSFLPRWKNDLHQLFSGISKDPFGGRRWADDFVEGELKPKEIQYSIFLVVFTVLPAGLLLYLSPAPQIQDWAKFFAAPLHAVVSGFLTAGLLYAGTYIVKKPRSFEYSYRIMLRVMSVYPILRLFSLNSGLFALSTLIYGLLVVRAAIKTLSMPIRNAVLFYGLTWAMFALMQLR